MLCYAVVVVSTIRASSLHAGDKDVTRTSFSHTLFNISVPEVEENNMKKTPTNPKQTKTKDTQKRHLVRRKGGSYGFPMVFLGDEIGIATKATHPEPELSKE